MTSALRMLRSVALLLACFAAGTIMADPCPQDACPHVANPSSAYECAAGESVHCLRPSDITVFGGFGDSITAAFGAKKTSLLDEFGIPEEYRGVSWSVGGDGSYTDTCTLPNIMEKLGSPAKKGAATKTGLGCYFDTHCGLDVAISGSTSFSIQGQATDYISRIRKLKGVDMDKDWKVATIFTGGNDLCDYCMDWNSDTAAKYGSNLEAGLDLLMAHVPRLFVNIVGVVDIGLVAALKNNTERKLMCSCLSEGVEGLASHAKGYRDAANQVASLAKYHTKDDFTVVYQPYYENFIMPTTPAGDADPSFFAPDMFHYNMKGHAEAAIALFNNMMEPVGSKRTWTRNMTKQLVCPTPARPYLATANNSMVNNAY